MKPFLIMAAALLLVVVASQRASACMCAELKDAHIVPVGPPPTSEEVLKWRAEQTDFALFTGRVIKIETVHVRRSLNSNEKRLMKMVTVAVQNYWLGVKESKIIIYTGVGNGDCGVPYRQDKPYLFVASREPVTRLLETDICGPTDVEDTVVTSFDEIFGRPKSFS